jgi:hypothetical protein
MADSYHFEIQKHVFVFHETLLISWHKKEQVHDIKLEDI